jgi:hypothetical protein
MRENHEVLLCRAARLWVWLQDIARKITHHNSCSERCCLRPLVGRPPVTEARASAKRASSSSSLDRQHLQYLRSTRHRPLTWHSASPPPPLSPVNNPPPQPEEHVHHDQDDADANAHTDDQQRLHTNDETRCHRVAAAADGLGLMARQLQRRSRGCAAAEAGC